MNIVYNGATSRTQIELTYDPKALNCWERFELDWEKFWSGTGGKVVAVTVFIAALVLAICCPQFAPILVTTVAGIGLTALIGGISGGLSSVENGGGFWSGFGSYIDENIAIIATSELIIAMATFGISQAVASVKSVQPVKATQAADTAERELPGVDGIIEDSTGIAQNKTIPRPPKKITGYTYHGFERALGRDGYGVNPQGILDAVKSPVDITYDPVRDTFKYTGKKSVTVLNQDGKIVTTWARGSIFWRLNRTK